MKFRVTYNSPVILSFTFICLGVVLFSAYIEDLNKYLALPGNFPWGQPQAYLRFLSYTCAHAYRGLGGINFSHFIGNFTIILLIGPSLEEKYGGKQLLLMMAVTAVVTGLLHTLLSNNGIIGASGLALMMIILASFTNYRKGDLPMTFIIISIFFLGNEVSNSFNDDNISQFAHIVGGCIGALFGFRYNKA